MFHGTSLVHTNDRMKRSKETQLAFIDKIDSLKSRKYSLFNRMPSLSLFFPLSLLTRTYSLHYIFGECHLDVVADDIHLCLIHLYGCINQFDRKHHVQYSGCSFTFSFISITNNIFVKLPIPPRSNNCYIRTHE